jgi:MFS transporter, DHA2 family, multidrug resistance protein
VASAQDSVPAETLPPGEYPPLRGMQLVLLTFAIGVSSFMEILDMTIVNVSVPSIAGSLGVSPSEGTWAISSYMLAAAVVQPLAGWIGRRFGEVRTFVSSVVLFMVFSAICGLATTMPMLIVARLMQGFVSGPMMSVAQALLLRNYPAHLRGLALGLWAMVVIVAPIFGPILGGWITDNYSWPWLFYINLPVAAAAAIISWGLLRKRESQRVKVPVDTVGLVLVHSTESVAAAVIAFVALAFLIPWELTDKHPVVDLHLLGRRNFRVGTVAIGFAYFAFTGVNVVFPLWLQTTLGYTATWAGFAMAPVGLIAIVMAPVVGRNLHKLNLRWAATIAFCIFATSLFWIAKQNETVAFQQLALPRLLQGAGLALFFLPLNQMLMSGIPARELASAAGLSNFIRTISGSMATAVCVWLWTDRSEHHHATLVQHVTPDSGAWTAYQQQLADQGIQGTQAFAYVDRLIGLQSGTLGANDLFYLLGFLFLALIPLVWMAKPPFGAIAAGSGGGH